MDKKTNKETTVKSLNNLTLEIDGIEQLEERLEMRKVCGKDCCKSSLYGRC